MRADELIGQDLATLSRDAYDLLGDIPPREWHIVQLTITIAVQKAFSAGMTEATAQAIAGGANLIKRDTGDDLLHTLADALERYPPQPA